MVIPKEKQQLNGERAKPYFREFAFIEDAYQVTPKLITMPTFELLYLLKLVRQRRSESYSQMNVFYKAGQSGNESYRDLEQDQGKEYRYWSRKMFVIENILLERGVFIPSRITSAFIQDYIDNLEKTHKKTMIVRCKRRSNP